MRLFGPVRLNFSKSGLGLSMGVPGLHVGTGPRGRYVRAGIPGTGIYYRKSMNGPAPTRTRAPKAKQLEKPWVAATRALLENRPADALAFLDRVKPGDGPAVHIEVDDDVIVTLTPDACGIAVMRAEANERLGRKDVALQIARAAADAGCHVAKIVADEIEGLGRVT